MSLAGADATRAQERPLAAAYPQQVSGPEISMLIRNTLAALHQANQTGNYTVLRDLGSSELRAANTPARLTDLFRDFREGKLNLAPLVLHDPALDDAPRLTTDGFLRLIGHFSTAPQEIVFDLTYRYESGEWRINNLAVGTRVAGTSEQVAEQTAAPIAIPVPILRPNLASSPN